MRRPGLPVRGASLAGLALLAACASTIPGFREIPQPAALPEAGRVVLFTGLNWSGESHRATGSDALAQEIRRAGVPGDVYRPGQWAQAAEAVLALDPRPAAIAAYGYSAGGPAAARFAARLGEAGVRLESLVLLDAWGSAEVACTVGFAIQYRLEPGDALSAARPGCAPVSNRVIDAALVARRGGLGHFSVAVDPEVMQLVLQQLVEGGRVRRRGTGP